jgi:hypothetical protein
MAQLKVRMPFGVSLFDSFGELWLDNVETLREHLSENPETEEWARDVDQLEPLDVVLSGT